MPDRIRVAGVQMDIQIGELEANTERLIARFRHAASEGAVLTAFPECSLSGYCFETKEEAGQFALTLESKPIAAIAAIARESKRYIVFGFLEAAGDLLFNSAICIGPHGICGTYRKVHLPFLGLDRFTTPGDRLEIVQLPTIDLRIGLNICYDCSFPEASRVLMLKGADLIVLPTNWPPTSGLTADYVPNARALENNIYVMAINRVGVERGFSFIGKSKICNPRGAEEASANQTDETTLFAEIDPSWARRKHLVNIPGVHEVDRLRDRHPECYQQVVELLKTQ